MILLLFVLWIVFNGKLTLEIALFGLVLCAALFLVAYKALDYSFKTELKLYVVLPSLILYAFLLIWEIIKANVKAALLIFGERRKPVSPKICEFRTSLKTDFFRVLLSNSITLTPGTITVSLTDDVLVVHCLDSSMMEGIDSTVFEKHLARIEERWLR